MSWENKYIADLGINYSRIIASWYQAGGRLETLEQMKKFKQWLKETEVLSDEQIDEIYMQATNGKLEWIDHAKSFLTGKTS